MMSFAVMTQDTRQRFWGGMSDWKAFACGLMLLTAAVTHARWPTYFLLDCPPAPLLGGGVLILFFPWIIRALPFVKKVRWGDKEIELQNQVEKLTADVQKIEEGPIPGGK